MCNGRAVAPRSEWPMTTMERVRARTGALPLRSPGSATNVLRRQCACGGHTSGGECDACRKKREATKACMRPFDRDNRFTANPDLDTTHAAGDTHLRPADSGSHGTGTDFSGMPVKAVKHPAALLNT